MPIEIAFCKFPDITHEMYICVCFVDISVARASEKCFSLPSAGCENNKS